MMFALLHRELFNRETGHTHCDNVEVDPPSLNNFHDNLDIH